jgi:hypothetical protein
MPTQQERARVEQTNSTLNKGMKGFAAHQTSPKIAVAPRGRNAAMYEPPAFHHKAHTVSKNADNQAFGQTQARTRNASTERNNGRDRQAQPHQAHHQPRTSSKLWEDP